MTIFIYSKKIIFLNKIKNYLLKSILNKVNIFILNSQRIENIFILSAKYKVYFDTQKTYSYKYEH